METEYKMIKWDKMTLTDLFLSFAAILLLGQAFLTWHSRVVVLCKTMGKEIWSAGRNQLNLVSSFKAAVYCYDSVRFVEFSAIISQRLSYMIFVG